MAYQIAKSSVSKIGFNFDFVEEIQRDIGIPIVNKIMVVMSATLKVRSIVSKNIYLLSSISDISFAFISAITFLPSSRFNLFEELVVISEVIV